MRKEICAIFAEFLPVVAKAYSLCHRTNQLEHDWTARIRCAQALAWCLVWVKWSTVGLMWEGGVQEEQHLASAEENTSNKHMNAISIYTTYSGIHCAYCAYTLWFWMSLVPSLRFVFDLKTRIKIGYHKRCRYCILLWASQPVSWRSNNGHIKWD